MVRIFANLLRFFVIIENRVNYRPEDPDYGLGLLGICFWRGVPEDVIEEIGEGEKGGWFVQRRSEEKFTTRIASNFQCSIEVSPKYAVWG
jgi:hypothetical protein